MAKEYEDAGFEIGVHVNTNCWDWTPTELADYFTAQRNGRPGTYVSGVHAPRVSGLGEPFFVVSRPRPSDDGTFNGVMSVAVLPSYFESFYARMSSNEGSYFALARTDGGFLARFPVLENRQVTLDGNSGLLQGTMPSILRPSS